MGFFFGGGLFVVYSIMFLLVFGIIVFTIIKEIAQWNKNNNSPRLIVEALVVTKRTEVTHNHCDTGNGAMTMMTSTFYYVTFQVESGDRIEFGVDSGEYSMLAEGDFGRLTFQGTRFIGFERR